MKAAVTKMAGPIPRIFLGSLTQTLSLNIILLANLTVQRHFRTLFSAATRFPFGTPIAGRHRRVTGKTRGRLKRFGNKMPLFPKAVAWVAKSTLAGGQTCRSRFPDRYPELLPLGIHALPPKMVTVFSP